jgi:hypothetical protein
MVCETHSTGLPALSSTITTARPERGRNQLAVTSQRALLRRHAQAAPDALDTADLDTERAVASAAGEGGHHHLLAEVHAR